MGTGEFCYYCSLHHYTDSTQIRLKRFSSSLAPSAPPLSLPRLPGRGYTFFLAKRYCIDVIWVEDEMEVQKDGWMEGGRGEN